MSCAREITGNIQTLPFRETVVGKLEGRDQPEFPIGTPNNRREWLKIIAIECWPRITPDLLPGLRGIRPL